MFFRIFYSVVSAAVFIVLTGVPFCVTALLYDSIALRVSRLVSISLLPVCFIAFITTLLLCAWLVRACFPALEPGTYPFPAHRMARNFGLHFLVQRVVHTSLWREFCFGIPVLRWLLLRALGCRAPLDMDTASSALVLDSSLMSFGRGCVLAAGTWLIGHYIKDGQLFLGRISLGERVQVFAFAVLGPELHVGDDTKIGLGTIAPGLCTIGRNVSIGSQCYIDIHTSIGDGAVIGDYVVLEPGVTVEPGAVIPRGIRIPKGAVVHSAAKSSEVQKESSEEAS